MNSASARYVCVIIILNIIVASKIMNVFAFAGARNKIYKPISRIRFEPFLPKCNAKRLFVCIYIFFPLVRCFFFFFFFVLCAWLNWECDGLNANESGRRCFLLLLLLLLLFIARWRKCEKSNPRQVIGNDDDVVHGEDRDNQPIHTYYILVLLHSWSVLNNGEKFRRHSFSPIWNESHTSQADCALMCLCAWTRLLHSIFCHHL